MALKLHRIERFIASAKFAVIIILIYAAYMAVGTFFESYYGTDYTGRAVYKHWGFFIVQGLMFLSIFYALLHRLPFKKRLYGFYTVHIGMITLFCGSFVTYFAGVDGNITLKANNPSRTVNLPRDMLYITDHSAGNEVTYLLPYTPGERFIGETYKGIKLKRWLPFSKDELKWVEPRKRSPSNNFPIIHGSSYQIFNDQVSQNFTMSLAPEALDFPSATQMGPLKINYLPAPLFNCFKENNTSGYIIWDSVANECFTPEERKIEIKRASSGKTFFVVNKNGMIYSFFPDNSPWPLEFDGKELKPAEDSTLRVFSKSIFQKSPHLFLFGEGIAYYSDDQWNTKELKINKSVELPWMGFEVILTHHENKKVPFLEPHYIRPIQVNNKIIEGDQRSLEIEVQGKTYWVKSGNPIALMIKGQKYSFFLGNQSLKLPYELNLSRFKMDTDPGTNNPASYESFVNVFDKDGVEKAHIFMNNPLKKGGFTLYQASYFQDDDGNYGSVLSVNFDPGRFWKYLGSLLIVLGSAWHFYIRRSQLKLKARATV